jgi:hypothetical protein
MSIVAADSAAPFALHISDLIEHARWAVRVAQARAESAERLATMCERRARVASGMAPMFLVEANRLRAQARRQVGEAQRHEGDLAPRGRSASFPAPRSGGASR